MIFETWSQRFDFSALEKPWSRDDLACKTTQEAGAGGRSGAVCIPDSLLMPLIYNQLTALWAIFASQNVTGPMLLVS